MTWSRARLVATGCAGRTTLERVVANAPQRWTIASRANGEWTEVYHQLIGDGSFGGDRTLTRINATNGANCVVRSASATPIRKGASVAAVRISALAGATVLYLPGAIVPHAGASHTSILRVATRRGGRALAAAVLVPGRSGRGERLAFASLRFRTTALIDGGEVFSEEVDATGGSALDGPGGFAGAGVFVNIVAVGPWDAAGVDWWEGLQLPASMAGGASSLRPGVLSFRALGGTLGDASAFVNAVAERAARAFVAPPR